MKKRSDPVFTPGKKRRGIALFVSVLLAASLAGSFPGAACAQPDSGAAALAEEWRARYGDKAQWDPIQDEYRDLVPAPGENEIPQMEALILAMELVMRAKGITVETLAAFQPFFGFTAYVDGSREWNVILEEMGATGRDPAMYFVTFDAATGEMLSFTDGGRG